MAALHAAICCPICWFSRTNQVTRNDLSARFICFAWIAWMKIGPISKSVAIQQIFKNWFTLHEIFGMARIKLYQRFFSLMRRGSLHWKFLPAHYPLPIPLSFHAIRHVRLWHFPSIHFDFPVELWQSPINHSPPWCLAHSLQSRNSKCEWGVPTANARGS